VVLTKRVPYAALVTAFEKIEKTTKRLEILEILTQFLLAVAKRDTATDAKNSNLLKVVYLCINRVSQLISPSILKLIIQLCPDYMGIELGIGETLLVKAIAESTGRATTKIKDDLRKEGDLGKVAMVCPQSTCSHSQGRTRGTTSRPCSSQKH
jgi:DNA ligase-1